MEQTIGGTRLSRSYLSQFQAPESLLTVPYKRSLRTAAAFSISSSVASPIMVPGRGIIV